jgi:predicted CXXCH cytochrome family protein
VAVALLAVLLVAVVGWRVMRPRGHGSRDVTAVPPVVTTPAVFTPASVPAPRPTKSVNFTDGCVTSECHANLWTARMVHAPIAKNECSTCHLPDSGGHKYPLTRTEESLCSTCHQTGHQVAFGHKATLDRGCLACHSPHGSGAASLLVADSVEKTCVRCHPGTPGSTAHKLYSSGQCDVCHQIHGADTAGLLRGGNVNNHCRSCHADVGAAMADATHSHADVEGSCLACHAAHASEHKKLLSAPPRERCIACHQDVGTTVTDAVVSHDAVLKGDQCISCHAPHAADNAMMLKSDQSPVCLGCHNKPVKAADGRTIPEMASVIAGAPLVHGPVAAGNCAACHSVHGGSHSRLLKQVDPNTLTGGFDLRNYALCGACHDQSLAVADAAAATQFRDGDTNLHWEHLQGSERSQGCNSCHAVHSSQGPRLIAETIAFEGSDWNMPIGFIMTPEGGSCAPGCHEPLSYSRTARGGTKPKKQGGTP